MLNQVVRVINPGRFTTIVQNPRSADKNMTEKLIITIRRREQSKAQSRLKNVMACHCAVPPSLPHFHISGRPSVANKRQTLLVETKRKRNKRPGNEEWRAEDKKVQINHAHISSHWRLQYVTRLWKAGSDVILGAVAHCPPSSATWQQPAAPDLFAHGHSIVCQFLFVSIINERHFEFGQSLLRLKCTRLLFCTGTKVRLSDT